jgi:hypothetical protein
MKLHNPFNIKTITLLKSAIVILVVARCLCFIILWYLYPLITIFIICSGIVIHEAMQSLKEKENHETS